jgi:hypothetical protein
MARGLGTKNVIEVPEMASKVIGKYQEVMITVRKDNEIVWHAWCKSGPGTTASGIN